MEYAKIVLNAHSSFITPLQSDTLFGHFAWGIHFLYGKERLEELLKDFTQNPFIIFSDGFKKETLPKPFLQPLTQFRCEEAHYIKRLKKLSSLPKELIFNNIDNLNEELFFEYLKQQGSEECKKTKTDAVIQKNSVDRLSNRVEEGLYSAKEHFLQDNQFEIYIAYQNISKDEIEEVLYFIAQRGFGKDKSTGKGKFTFTIKWDFEEKTFFQTKRGKYLNLSTMLFNPSNMLLYYGKTLTKFPKAGGYYAGSEPFKNPFICYLPGSTFIVADGILGRGESKIFNKNNHYQNGFSIGIYFDGE